MKKRLFIVLLAVSFLLGLAPNAFAEINFGARDVVTTVTSTVVTEPTTTHSHYAYSDIERVSAPSGKYIDLRNLVYTDPMARHNDLTEASELYPRPYYLADFDGWNGNEIYGNPYFKIQVLSLGGARNIMKVYVYDSVKINNKVYFKEVGIRVYARSNEEDYSGPGWTQAKTTIKFRTLPHLINEEVEEETNNQQTK